MQARRRRVAGTIAFVVLIASLAGLWQVLPENAEVRLSGERLLEFVRAHPPKPWKGFKIDVLGISVDREVHIKAHVSGNMIHTPVEITGTPEYKPDARAMFFRVSKVELPQDAVKPLLGGLSKMLNPLGSYVAQNLTDFIPVKKIKPDTRGGALFLTTVKGVRVDGDAVAVALHGYRIAAAAVVLILVALLAAGWLITTLLRTLRSVKR